MNCPVCQHPHTVTHVTHPQDREYFVIRKMESRYLQCSQCHSIFLTPRPTASETGTFYTADYQNYSKSKAPFINELFNVLQRMALRGFKKKYELNSKILDYGCNQGQFLKLLATVGYQNLHGYDVVPLEKNPDGAFTFHKNLEDLEKSTLRFDVIRLNHVIEHLPDPNQVLTMLQKLLTPTGKIIGQMPNAAHYSAKLFKGFWGPLHFPYHLTLFSAQGLQSNATRWGLECTHCPPTIVPTGWAMSFENLLKPIIAPKRSGRSSLYIFFIAASAPFVLLDRALACILSTAVIDFELTKRKTP